MTVGAHWACQQKEQELRLDIRAEIRERRFAEAQAERWKANAKKERECRLIIEAENERLRVSLARLVDLGEDDGSASDNAWSTAFAHASELLKPVQVPGKQ